MNHAEMKQLGRALRVLGEHALRLEAGETEHLDQEVRDDIERALALVNENETVKKGKPTTRCREHPRGPVDEDARDGCLLCETRRRSGAAAAAPRPRSGDDDEDKPIPVVSGYRVRDNSPEAVTRWVPEEWDGAVWHICGAPRTSEKEGAEFLEDRFRSRPSGAFRLVKGFTDHNVVRTWGDTRVVVPEPPVF